jgi:hypothetical protein
MSRKIFKLSSDKLGCFVVWIFLFYITINCSRLMGFKLGILKFHLANTNWD